LGPPIPDAFASLRSTTLGILITFALRVSGLGLLCAITAVDKIDAVSAAAMKVGRKCLIIFCSELIGEDYHQLV
jgi:hypothetical protein